MNRKLFLMLLFVLALIFGTNAQSETSMPGQTQVLREQVSPKSFPVMLFHDTLFHIDAYMGNLTPEERAKNISARIERIYYEYDSIQITLTQNEKAIDVVCGEIFIMTLQESDTIIQGKNIQMLANEYAERIKSSIEKNRKERSILTILTRIGLVLLVLGAIWLMIFLIAKGHTYFAKRLLNYKGKWFKNLSYKGYTFITANQELKVIVWLLKVLKWAIIAILIYLFLPLVFSIFPFSRGWAAKLFSFIWNPFKGIFVSIWHYLPNLFTIIVLFIVFKYLIRFIKYIFSEIEAGKLRIPGFHVDWAKPTFSIVRFLMYAFMFILIFPYLPGSESRVFQGVSVFLGLLVSLGSSSAIANMVAGLVITYMRPFKIGDRIKIGEVTGNVVEKTMLVTRLRTSNNESITIPNSAILSGNTTNYSALAATEGLILSTKVTISYQTPWRTVQKALLEAAGRTSNLLHNKKHFVIQSALDQFHAVYQLNVYTSEGNAFAPIYNELHQNIQDVCAEYGIEIVSPQFLIQYESAPSITPPVDTQEDCKKGKK